MNLYPKTEDLNVVIASDHGQLMGVSTQVANVPVHLTLKGRMALGRADRPGYAVLDKERYSLPEDISVIRGSLSFNSFSYADDKSIIGSHGGLYPEEVVVGFSVMKKILQRVPVIITCSGEGKPREPGILSIKFVKSLAISVLTRLVFLLADSQRLEFLVLSLSGCWIKLCLVMDH